MSKHFDILIIGAGPSGLSAAAHAAELGVSYLVLEAETQAASTVRKYQRGKHVMAEPRGLPTRSPLPFTAAPRETVLERWEAAIAEYNINIRYEAKVTGIRPKGEKLEV